MTIPRFEHPDRSFLDRDRARPEDAEAGDIVIFGAGHGSPYLGLGDVQYETDTLSADAPDAIRAGANESSSNIDHYDFDLGGPLLADSTARRLDCGNRALSPDEGPGNRKHIHDATFAILRAGGTPIMLGGDDSVPIPFLRAFRDRGPIDVLQIDAHIDWRDTIDGEPNGYSSTMIRASENPFVRSITQIGMRGVGSARQAEVDTAKDWGARLVTVRETRKIGPRGIIDLIPKGGNLVIQIDCDAFDTSVCPAVNAPTPGGFQFEELAEILRGVIAARHTIGFSIVELVPALDLNKVSAIAAARITCNVIGSLSRAG